MRSLASSATCLALVCSLAIRGSGIEETKDPIALARAAIARGDLDAAMTELASALTSDQDGQAIELAIATLEAKGDLTAALELADRSFGDSRSGQTRIRTALVRSRLLLALGRREESLQAARSAVDALRDPARRGALAIVWLDLAKPALDPENHRTRATEAGRVPNLSEALFALDAALATEALGERTIEAELDRLTCLARLARPAIERKESARRLLAHEGLANGQRMMVLSELVSATSELEDDPAALAAARALDALPEAKDLALLAWSRIAASGNDDLAHLPAQREATARLAALDPAGDAAEAARIRLSEFLAKDVSWVDLAIEELEAARAARPDSPRGAEIESRIADLRVARDGPLAALPRLEAFLVGRPFDDAARRIADRIEKLHLDEIARCDQAIRVAMAHDEEREVTAARRASIDARRRFVEKYPAHEWIPVHLFETARLETAIGDFESAARTRDALRARFPDREQAALAIVDHARDLAERRFEFDQALALIESITTPSSAVNDALQLRSTILDPTLEFLATPVVRSGEPVKLKLRCRNVGDAELALYRIDLRDFFLATGHFHVLRTLDVSLIAPDRKLTADAAPDDATSHRETIREVTLDAMAAGQALVVTARAANRESSSFVLCSDLDVAIVRTGEEVRAFGVDHRTGATTEIALRAAHGGELLAKDAVITRELAQDSLQILAIAGNDLAVLRANGNAPEVVERKPFGALVLDRLAARGGDIVRYVGFAQDASGMAAAKNARLTVTTIGESRRGYDEFAIALDANGRFSGDWSIDPALAAGANPVDIELALSVEGATPRDRITLATTTLRVGPFLRSHRSIHFEPVGEPPFGGDAATLTVRITDFDGIVRPGAEATWRIGDGEEHRVLTDDSGRFVVAIGPESTRDRSTVEVAVSSGSESDVFTYPLRSRRVYLSVERGVLPDRVVVGDTVELGLRLFTDLQDPIAESVSWRLARRSVLAREDRASGVLKTGADGRATLSLPVTEPGEFELRLEYRGRYDLPERHVLEFAALAADGSSSDGLELIGGRATPGGSAELRALWPFERSRALLVTFGSTLERAELVTLERGTNRFPVVAPKEPLSHVEARMIALDRPDQAFDWIAIDRPAELTIEAPNRVTAQNAPIEAKLSLTGADRGARTRGIAIVAAESIGRRFEQQWIASRMRRFPSIPRSVAQLASSGEFEPEVDHSTIDALVEQTLAQMEEVASADAPVLVDSLRLDEMIRRRELSQGGATFRGPGDVQDPGAGGGGGGPTTGGGGASAGGRSLGKASRRVVLDEPPHAFADDLSFADSSTIAWRFAPPEQPGRYRIVAIAIDESGEMAIASRSFLHDPAVVGALALTDHDIANPRVASVVLANRDPSAGAIDVRLVTDTPSAPPLASRSVELPAFSATTLRLDVPAGVHRGAFECGVGPVLRFEPEIREDVDLELVIARARPFTLTAARRTTMGSRSGSILASPMLALSRLPDDSFAEPERVEWCTFAAAEALRLARSMPDDAVPAAELATLEKRVVDRLEALRATLGFDASRPRGASERAALVLLALDAAKDSEIGARVPWLESLLEAAVTRVESELLRAKTPDRRALPLWALARAGQASYEKLNRLVRDAESLETRGLALLTLALVESGRLEEAANARAKLVSQLSATNISLASNAPASEPLGSRREIAALIALAAPDDPAAIALVERELSSVPLSAPSGAAPLALLALARDSRPVANATLRGTGFERRLEFVGRGATAVAALEPFASGIPEGDLSLAAEENVLITFLPGGHDDAAEPSDFVGSRSLFRTLANRDGKDVVVGATWLGRPSIEGRQPVDRLGIGRTYSVETRIAFDHDARSFWWFEPNLPGTRIVESSLPESTPCVEAADGRWFLFDSIRDSARAVRLQYSVLAIAPGSFRAGPSAMRWHRASESRTVESAETVYSIEPGDVDADTTPTPNEALAMGLAATKEVRFADAFSLLMSQLDGLLDEEATLTTRNECLRALLDCALEAAPDSEIVRIFEIAKERDPDRVLGFAAMDRVARAYAALGEWERSRFVLSAIGDSLFLQEARVVGSLEDAAQDRLAVEVIERLLAEHDVTPVTLETAFALGQHAAERARSAKFTAVDAKRELSRGEWQAVARRTLERFLTFSGKDDADEEVTLTLANLLLDAGDGREASQLANAAAMRFSRGRFTATWPYIEAFASLQRRDLDATIRHAERLVAAAESSDDPIQRKLAITGRHMLAQSFHAKGDLARARPLYERIRDDVADARLVLEQLDRSAFSAPTVVTTGSGADWSIPIERKGASGDLEVSLYPVDLRLLYLKRRGFDDLADLELAGVTPIRRTIATPVRDPSTLGEKVAIPNPGKGAYVVFLRAGDLHCRLVAIVSDLAIETTLLPQGSRILAFDRATGAPRSDVLVTFVGSGNERFVTRKTDLRGIAAADGLAGRLAVIAELDGHYAFFQSEDDLAGQSEYRLGEDGFENAADPAQNEAYEQLESERARNDEVWKANTNRAQQGVEIRRTKK